jgi:hypothetical protein
MIMEQLSIYMLRDINNTLMHQDFDQDTNVALGSILKVLRHIVHHASETSVAKAPMPSKLQVCHPSRCTCMCMYMYCGDEYPFLHSPVSYLHTSHNQYATQQDLAAIHSKLDIIMQQLALPQHPVAQRPFEIGSLEGGGGEMGDREGNRPPSFPSANSDIFLSTQVQLESKGWDGHGQGVSRASASQEPRNRDGKAPSARREFALGLGGKGQVGMRQVEPGTLSISPSTKSMFPWRSSDSRGTGGWTETHNLHAAASLPGGLAPTRQSSRTQVETNEPVLAQSWWTNEDAENSDSSDGIDLNDMQFPLECGAGGSIANNDNGRRIGGGQVAPNAFTEHQNAKTPPAFGTARAHALAASPPDQHHEAAAATAPGDRIGGRDLFLRDASNRAPPVPQGAGSTSPREVEGGTGGVSSADGRTFERRLVPLPPSKESRAGEHEEVATSKQRRRVTAVSVSGSLP